MRSLSRAISSAFRPVHDQTSRCAQMTDEGERVFGDSGAEARQKQVRPAERLSLVFERDLPLYDFE